MFLKHSDSMALNLQLVRQMFETCADTWMHWSSAFLRCTFKKNICRTSGRMMAFFWKYGNSISSCLEAHFSEHIEYMRLAKTVEGCHIPPWLSLYTHLQLELCPQVGVEQIYSLNRLNDTYTGNWLVFTIKHRSCTLSHDPILGSTSSSQLMRLVVGLILQGMRIITYYYHSYSIDDMSYIHFGHPTAPPRSSNLHGGRSESLDCCCHARHGTVEELPAGGAEVHG